MKVKRVSGLKTCMCVDICGKCLGGGVVRNTAGFREAGSGQSITSSVPSNVFVFVFILIFLVFVRLLILVSQKSLGLFFLSIEHVSTSTEILLLSPGPPTHGGCSANGGLAVAAFLAQGKGTVTRNVGRSFLGCVDTFFSAMKEHSAELFEIYKIDTFLHCSKLKFVVFRITLQKVG